MLSKQIVWQKNSMHTLIELDLITIEQRMEEKCCFHDNFRWAMCLWKKWSLWINKHLSEIYGVDDAGCLCDRAKTEAHLKASMQKNQLSSSWWQMEFNRSAKKLPRREIGSTEHGIKSDGGREKAKRNFFGIPFLTPFCLILGQVFWGKQRLSTLESICENSNKKRK